MATFCLSIKSNDVSTKCGVGCLGRDGKNGVNSELVAPFRARLTLFAFEAGRAPQVQTANPANLGLHPHGRRAARSRPPHGFSARKDPWRPVMAASPCPASHGVEGGEHSRCSPSLYREESPGTGKVAPLLGLRVPTPVRERFGPGTLEDRAGLGFRVPARPRVPGGKAGSRERFLGVGTLIR